MWMISASKEFEDFRSLVFLLSLKPFRNSATAMAIVVNHWIFAFNYYEFTMLRTNNGQTFGVSFADPLFAFRLMPRIIKTFYQSVGVIRYRETHDPANADISFQQV